MAKKNVSEIERGAGSAEQPKPREQTGSPYRGGPTSDLPPNHYRLHVSYAPLPGVAALEPKFSGKNSVSYLFDGRAWERHSSCVTIDEISGEREFLVAEVPEQFLGKRIDAVWNDLATHFDREGFRFAIETEAVEFSAAQPELQRKNWIYAIGSSALRDDGNRCVAVLFAFRRGRILGGGRVGRELDGGVRVLLVRK